MSKPLMFLLIAMVLAFCCLFSIIGIGVAATVMYGEDSDKTEDKKETNDSKDDEDTITEEESNDDEEMVEEEEEENNNSSQFGSLHIGSSFMINYDTSWYKQGTGDQVALFLYDPAVKPAGALNESITISQADASFVEVNNANCADFAIGLEEGISGNASYTNASVNNDSVRSVGDYDVCYAEITATTNGIDIEQYVYLFSDEDYGTFNVILTGGAGSTNFPLFEEAVETFQFN